MDTKTQSDVLSIPLEKPASIKRLLPSFNEDWTISDYIAGKENESVQHLFSDESLDNLNTLSPVVLYGEKGLGKTALAVTLAVRWSRKANLRPLCLTTGVTFCKEYAAAVEIDDIESFRDKHRKCKLLVIDDFEAIAEKKSAQVELCNTIDHLTLNEIPIVVTVSKLPASCDGITSALSSRLSAGYSLALQKIQGPSIAVAIEKLAKKIDAGLNCDVLQQFCLFKNVPYAIEDLRALVLIAHQNKDAEGSVDTSLLNKLMDQHLAGGSLSTAIIAKTVARKMGVKLTDMRGSTRQANIVRARGLAILLCRKLTASSLQQIGSFFGGRDHSTVLHACRKTDKLVATDSELSSVLCDVQAELLS